MKNKMDKKVEFKEAKIPILHIPVDGEVIKAITLVDLLRDMKKIEYEMDKLNDFGKVHPEHYQVMWNLLKGSMSDEIIGKKK